MYIVYKMYYTQIWNMDVGYEKWIFLSSNRFFLTYLNLAKNNVEKINLLFLYLLKKTLQYCSRGLVVDFDSKIFWNGINFFIVLYFYSMIIINIKLLILFMSLEWPLYNHSFNIKSTNKFYLKLFQIIIK